MFILPLDGLNLIGGCFHGPNGWCWPELSSDMGCSERLFGTGVVLDTVVDGPEDTASMVADSGTDLMITFARWIGCLKFCGVLLSVWYGLMGVQWIVRLRIGMVGVIG